MSYSANTFGGINWWCFTPR